MAYCSGVFNLAMFRGIQHYGAVSLYLNGVNRHYDHKSTLKKSKASHI